MSAEVHAEEDPARFACMVDQEPFISLEVPMSIPSRANLEKNHWHRQKLVKAQRDALSPALLPYRLSQQYEGNGWCWTVRLTRVSPKALDWDNASNAMKAIQDFVAEFLGYDDADEHIAWLPVKQQKDPLGRPKFQAARIEIWLGHQECPCCGNMVVPRKMRGAAA